jgi:hypothetical protein
MVKIEAGRIDGRTEEANQISKSYAAPVLNSQ